jgi:predicted nucleic acid-binding protein
MNEPLAERLAIDATVLLKLFTPVPERNVEQAAALLARWESGGVKFVAPDLLALEALNIAGRRWGFDEPAMLVLLRVLQEFDIAMLAPELERVVRWTSIGLSAYDAAYVAIAEAERVPLVTDDDQIVALAGEHAIALGSLAA